MSEASDASRRHTEELNQVRAARAGDVGADDRELPSGVVIMTFRVSVRDVRGRR